MNRSESLDWQIAQGRKRSKSGPKSTNLSDSSSGDDLVEVVDDAVFHTPDVTTHQTPKRKRNMSPRNSPGKRSKEELGGMDAHTQGLDSQNPSPPPKSRKPNLPEDSSPSHSEVEDTGPTSPKNQTVEQKAETESKNQTTYRKPQNLPPPSFQKYPVVVEDLGTGAATLRSLGPSTAFKLWKNTIGEIENQRPLGGSRWLVGCRSAAQQSKLAGLTSLGQIDIRCSVPQAVTEGVIKQIPLEEKIEDLLPSIPFGKSAIRLKNRDGSESRAVKITFNCAILPKFIKIHAEEFPVHTYVAPVRRCRKCARFGHSMAQCRSKKETCVRCGLTGHAVPECKNTARCTNCSGPHSAAYLGCREYQIRLRANKIRAEAFLPYALAMQQAKTQLNNEERQKIKNKQEISPPVRVHSAWRSDDPPGGVSYAQVVSKKTKEPLVTTKLHETQNSNMSRPRNRITSLRKRSLQSRAAAVATLHKANAEKRVEQLVQTHIEKHTQKMVTILTDHINGLLTKTTKQRTDDTSKGTVSNIIPEIIDLKNSKQNECPAETFIHKT